MPWRKPRHEALLVALVAVVALTPLHLVSPQDASHFCLSRALEHGRLTIDGCIGRTEDRSRYNGHFYSNKAPGLSLLALPVVAAVGLPPPNDEHHTPSWRLWLVRVLTSGIAFVLCAVLAGRIAEGLAPGRGGLALVAFALGTLVAPFAATGFDHVPSAAFAFVSFALAWRRRAALAGIAAGAAVLCEYEAILVAVILAVYVLRLGRRPFGRFLAGAAPGAALLAAYDWVAFGAPWHNPLSYSANHYRAEHAHGLLGLGLPTLAATERTLVGGRGLIVLSPVLVAAAAGLVLVWRRGYRAEAAACAAVALALLVAEIGYFDPLGGWSPGPRFFGPALPFLAVGLGPALARWRRPAVALAAASVLVMTAATVTWSVQVHWPHTLWGSLARVPLQGRRSALAHVVPESALGGTLRGAIVAVLAAAAAFVLAARSQPPAPS